MSVTLRTPPALLERVDALAEQRGSTRTAVILEGLAAVLAADAGAAPGPALRLELDDATGPAILARAIAEAILARAIAERSTVGEVAERAIRAALNRQMAEPPKRRRRKNDKAPG